MIKPTEHYEELRKALDAYRLDGDYATVERVAHALLDIRVWAESIGIGRKFAEAVCLSCQMMAERGRVAGG